MIQLTGAGKRYGPKILFENVDWLVTPNDRIGIVGANGTGKSSILKVLAGIEGLDSGSITTQKGVTIGYLPQEGLSLSGRSVFAECMTVFDDLARARRGAGGAHAPNGGAGPRQRRVRAGCRPLSSRGKRVSGARRVRDRGAGRRVLSGLGFPQREWKKRTEEFSGGWQMRIALAKLLLEKPNLLLLDEPTNHLDLEARNWLEEYLGELSERVRAGVARPLLPRRHRPQDRGIVEQGPAFLYRRLHAIRAAEERAPRAASGGLREPAGPDPAARIVHQSLPVPGDQGQAGAEPHQGAGADRADRDSAGREDDPFQLPAAEAERPDRGGIQGRRQELRRPLRVLGRRFLYRARRAGRAGGREWRGQIDADQNSGRGGAGDGGDVHAWAQRAARTTSRRTSTRNSTRTRG